MPSQRLCLSTLSRADRTLHRFDRSASPRDRQRPQDDDGVRMPDIPNELLKPILQDAMADMTLAQQLKLTLAGRRIRDMVLRDIFETTVVPACPWGDAFRYTYEVFTRKSGLRPLVKNLRFSGRVQYSHRSRPFDTEIDPENIIRLCSRLPNLETIHLEHMTCNIPLAYYSCTPPYPVAPRVHTLTIDLNETTSAVDLVISLLPSFPNVTTLTVSITRVINIDFCNLLADLLTRKSIRSKRLRLGYCSQDKTPLINQCLRIAGPLVHHLTLDLVAIDPELHEDFPYLYVSIRRALLLKDLIVTIPYSPREWVHEAEASIRPLMKLLRTCPASLETLTITFVTRPRNYDDLCAALSCIPLHDILDTLAKRSPLVHTVELNLDIDRACGSGPDVESIWGEAYKHSPLWEPVCDFPTVYFT